MNNNSDIDLSLLFEFVLQSELENKKDVAKTQQEQMDKYSSAYSSIVHVFYNMIYKERFELNSKTFYYTDETSPCLIWFDTKCSYRDLIPAKVLEYAIKDAYGMVKSDKEKDIQHLKQVEVWKERLSTVYDDIKKTKQKINEHRSRKKLKKLRSLINEVNYLNKKIHQKFSSRRVFGTKKLMLEINNAEINARKQKALKTNRSLQDTYLTENEKEEVKKYKLEKQILYNQKRTGIFKTIGNAQYHGNRYFELTDDPSVIILKFTKDIRIPIVLKDLRGYDDVLKRIYEMSINKQIPLTMTLNTKSHTIAISYSATLVYGDEWHLHNIKKQRVMSIDLNPDDVGYVIVDWHKNYGFRIIDSGVYSLKILNEEEKSLNGKGIKSSDPRRKYYSNKRIFETREIAHALTDTAAYYKCDIFAMEQLKFDNYYNKNRSKEFNRLVNKMWKRTEFVRIIEKDCKLYNIKSMQVIAAYSSFVGNLVFRSLGLPDMCLAAFELGRRAFMLKYMNIKENDQDKLLEDVESSGKENKGQKRKGKNKGIIFTDMRQYKCFGSESLEEFREAIPDNLHGCLDGTVSDAATLYDIYKVLGTSMVRVKLYKFNQQWLNKRTYRFRSRKSLV